MGRRDGALIRLNVPDTIGDTIDRPITVELKNRGMAHEFLARIHEAARAEGGGRPLGMRTKNAQKMGKICKKWQKMGTPYLIRQSSV